MAIDVNAVVNAAYTKELTAALAADAVLDAAAIAKLKADSAAALAKALADDAAADAAATAALNAQITKLKADLAACQAGNPGPVDPPPVDPPTGTFVWKGLQTPQLTKEWMLANTGPRIPVTPYTGGFPVSGLVLGKKFSSRLQPNQVSNGAHFKDCELPGGIDGNSKKYTVERCKIYGGGNYGALVGTVTALFNDISGFEDGIKLQFDGWVIRGNYLHDPWIGPVAHNDAIQVQWGNSNGLIEQNRAEWHDTSEIFLQELTGQIDNITVRHNWIGGSDLPLRIEAGCTNCKAYENVIKQGNPTYPNKGYYDLNSTVEHHGNIDSVTGAALDG